jgi:hypothetical protein
MAKQKKLRIESEAELIQAVKSEEPKVGDIVQVTTNPHVKLANIGIVHTLEGDMLRCYNPGRQGKPEPWIIPASDCAVVGHARLKFKKPLPDDSTAPDDTTKL